MFDCLGVHLLYFTTYHPQTDEQSECTNQTTKIALQFYIATLDESSRWPAVLLHLQTSMNNSTSSTGKSSNETVYGFTLNQALSLTGPEPADLSSVHTQVEA